MYSYVVNSEGYCIAYVIPDRYELRQGESFVKIPPPTKYNNPHWNGVAWEEVAALEELDAVNS